MATQLGLFDGENEFHLLDKPIRLISLFSGYDSQALALKYLGVPFEHYKTCEWAIPSILALYDLHFSDNHKKSENNDLCNFYAQKISKDYSNPLNYKQVCKLGEEKLREIDEAVINSNNLLNITSIHGKDLEIVDTKHYNYILTYSFPCQDLSLSGSRKGMSEESGTRSSLLWEVGRLLDECSELPQFLLMENVPQVLERNNIKEFGKWIDRLESKGYKCYYKVLNAKDYGVPQNRARCYMVSILGDYKYYFPEPTNELVKLADILEDEVDEKYYISKDTLHTALTTPYWSATLGERPPRDEDGLAHTLKADATNEVVADLVAFDKDGNLYDSTEDKDNLIGQFENHRKWHKKQEESKLTAFTKRKENPNQEKLSIEVKEEQKGIVLHTGNKVLNETALKIDVNDPEVQYLDCYDRVIKKDTSQTIKTTINSSNEDYIYTNYRIRKLTPRECYRLMGVRDEDYDKIAPRQSEKALYHMAGDSIVVNVLMAIFKEVL